MCTKGSFYGRCRSYGESAWHTEPYYSPSTIPDPTMSQKLDRVLALLEVQGKDIESMRVDAATMEEIKDLKHRCRNRGGGWGAIAPPIFPEGGQSPLYLQPSIVRHSKLC